MARENFPPKTRRLIEARAGHQCSFPTCNRRTTGAGPTSRTVSESGYAAHIYAASPKGPRGRDDLTPTELSAPENGIWLCARHAKLVDNNRGTGYPPETLLSYKALQEARVSLEHEGLYSPVGWLHELTIAENPIFTNPQTVRLSKLNLLYGPNETGKTAMTEWIRGFFEPGVLDRWRPTGHSPLQVDLTFLNPKVQHLKLTAEDGNLQFSIDGTPVAFIPIGLRILAPKRPDYSESDDLHMIAHALGIQPTLILNLASEINQFPNSKVSNVRFETRSDGSSALRCDAQGTVPGLGLRSLSGREAERLMLEFVTAAARLSGRYCPTLLVLDELPTILFDGFFEFYSHHLLDPANQFQTLMCVPERSLDLDRVRWNGWEVIRMIGKSPDVQTSQEVRTGGV